MSFDDANQAPVAKLDHANTLQVKAGDTFLLSAENCEDPDGDNLSYLWIYYPEAGMYRQPINILGSQNIHLI